ncbi:MAG: hypothetical protein WC025_03765 [Candidatus Magasanikbacteria bacterium]
MENPRKDMEALLNNTAQTAEPFDKFTEREKEIRALSDAAILKQAESKTTEIKAKSTNIDDGYVNNSEKIFSKFAKYEQRKQEGEKTIEKGIEMIQDVSDLEGRKIKKAISIAESIKRSDAETLRREKEIEGLKKLAEEREARKKLLEASREGKNTPPPVPSDSK